MKRIGLTVAAVAGTLVLWASPVWAHNSLVEAVPAKDSALTELPEEVKLRFLSSLQPDTKLTVVDAAGNSAIGEVTIDGKVISAPFVGTVGGQYTVGYQLTASDGHTTTKSYTFTATVQQEPVAQESRTPEQALTADVPAATPISGKEGPPWWLYIGGAAVAGLMVGGVITLLSQRRRDAGAKGAA